MDFRLIMYSFIFIQHFVLLHSTDPENYIAHKYLKYHLESKTNSYLYTNVHILAKEGLSLVLELSQRPLRLISLPALRQTEINQLSQQSGQF